MEELIAFLKEGVTAAHTIACMKETLLKNGYEELEPDREWQLQENGKYYVNLFGTNGFAFRIGKKMDQDPIFRIAMAHSDYPNFQIKPNPEQKDSYVTRLNVEIYGGMYQKSWLDRPLGVAGTVVLEGDNPFCPKTLCYKSNRALCMIPSLAIHMDRELNRKGALETSKELVPLLTLSGNGNLLDEVAKSLHVQKEEILDYDLYLYNMDEPTVVGLDRSMIASPRLDNLTSVSAILQAMIKGEIANCTVAGMAVFDNEEVGSLSKQGADSELLSMLLQKIGKALFGGDFSLLDGVNKSFLLSVDVAHGNHPNYPEKSDVTNKADLGKGFCIKRSVGQKYGTTAVSVAVVQQLCKKKDIPFTIAINKTGIPGGSTLGPIASSHLPFPCADVGMPILAMHSAVELGAGKDYEALEKFLETFFYE